MTRQEKARYIIEAGHYIIHECNLSDVEPTDDTKIYYMSDSEIDDIYNQTKANEEEEKTMSNTFNSITGIEYTCNDLQTRFYTVDAEGKKTRISRKAYEEAKADHEAEKPDNLFTAYMDYIEAADKPEPTEAEIEAKAKEIETPDIVPLMDAISKAVDEAEQTDEAWEAEAEAEREAREAKIAEDAKATEDAVNGIMATLTEEKPEKGKKKAKKEKTGKKDQPKAETKEKAKKTRKSKDIAHEHKDGDLTITLTAKQVDFVLHLSDSAFWEKGLDSILWCDVLCDEIGGQFEGKPMTIGAMISTLCEKGLGIRTKDRLTDEATGRSRKGTTFQLTEKGKEIAKELGLH